MDLERMYYETPYVEIQEVLLPFVLAYRPHTEPDISGERIDKISHCNMKDIKEELDML